MDILAHRGWWGENIDKNSPKAIRTALEKGYGFESDIRDYDGYLIISHDIGNIKCQRVEQVFKWLREFEDQFTFAINIKSDGLKGLISDLISNYKINNYFLFDMSVPQMVEYNNMGLRYYTRQSEIEEDPCMYKEASGVWIDGFYGTDWITDDLLDNHIKNKKEVCIVSPELHGFTTYKEFWNRLKMMELDFDHIMLCTDYPDEAREFFYE